MTGIPGLFPCCSNRKCNGGLLYFLEVLEDVEFRFIFTIKV